ncbi:glycosyltransferase family 2 protein [Thermococcus nautili]|uniref:Glycosyltransferases involved in cell wall biogenesis n=1 Tax=Thermococcus nautili TaxID=195522 RepID=W8PM07_9EURY|nr:glycosyltransferase family 2 protein [Thermococcus nautili]AHL23104.1 Glycosyltransferases involved in cell wall biogenesis [Thermococcus nautili]
MKLAVTIPAYNEEKTIPNVIREIRELKPDDFEGKIDDIKIIVVNDGSKDNTARVAKEAGADIVVSFRRNRGLARAFRQGIETALEIGADIIVNIDADGQYNAKEIPKLVKPILDGKADIVLGSRFKGWIEYMPMQKRIGNKIATWVTRIASGFPTSDAQTGFRAFSRDAAMRLHVLADYTYVQETIIQANHYGLKIVEVPVQFRKRQGDGKSRLISNIFGYAKRAGMIILRSYRDYNPLKVFGIVGAIFIIVGLYFGWRVLSYYYTTGSVGSRLPSAILATLLLIIGVQTVVLGLLADMLKSQRMLLDDVLYRLKKLEYEKKE